MADKELVIKIPEEDYKTIKNGSVVGDLTVPYVFDAIRNGTILPKGHGRLIDATILRMGFVVSARFNGTWNLGKTRILNHIDNAQTIIEADKESKDAHSH